MLKLASDEDVPGAIVTGLRRREPSIDIVRVQDAGLRSRADAEVLEWAASEGRVLLTFDRTTMTQAAFQRVSAGQSMPGLVVLTGTQPVGETIEDVLLVAASMTEEEVRDQAVIFLPL